MARELVPLCARERLARFCDVFCEEGVFHGLRGAGDSRVRARVRPGAPSPRRRAFAVGRRPSCGRAERRIRRPPALHRAGRDLRSGPRRHGRGRLAGNGLVDQSAAGAGPGPDRSGRAGRGRERRQPWHLLHGVSSRRGRARLSRLGPDGGRDLDRDHPERGRFARARLANRISRARQVRRPRSARRPRRSAPHLSLGGEPRDGRRPGRGGRLAGPSYDSIRRLSLDDFLSSLASEAPTPGGGTAAAVIGAMGAALAEMVAGLTLAREKYAAVHETMREIAALAARARADFLALADQDAAAYDQVIAARRMPTGERGGKRGARGAYRRRQSPGDRGSACDGPVERQSALAPSRASEKGNPTRRRTRALRPTFSRPRPGAPSPTWRSTCRESRGEGVAREISRARLEYLEVEVERLRAAVRNGFRPHDDILLNITPKRFALAAIPPKISLDTSVPILYSGSIESRDTGNGSRVLFFGRAPAAGNPLTPRKFEDSRSALFFRKSALPPTRIGAETGRFRRFGRLPAVAA